MGVYERKSAEERFWEKVDKCETGCWEWRGYTNSEGYGVINKDGKKMLSHRVSYEIHHPLTQPIQDIKMCVMHSCDNPKCVNPAHLSLGTHQDNMTDKVEKGRHPIGEQIHQAKLTEQQVIEIRNRYTGKRGQHQQIATEYGLDRSTISKIITRKTWANLQ